MIDNKRDILEELSDNEILDELLARFELASKRTHQELQAERDRDALARVCKSIHLNLEAGVEPRHIIRMMQDTARLWNK